MSSEDFKTILFKKTICHIMIKEIVIKKRLLSITLLLFLSLLLNSMLIPTVSATHSYANETESDCNNPTKDITISADKTGFKFDKTELTVPRGVCVQLTFTNLGLIEHDFVIDNFDFTSGKATLYILLIYDGSKTLNFTTPDLDKTYKFFCAFPGHEKGGMKGKLIVGEGSAEEDAPGFGLIFAFSALFAMTIAITRFKRK